MVGSGNGASKWAEMLFGHVWGGPAVGTTIDNVRELYVHQNNCWYNCPHKTMDLIMERIFEIYQIHNTSDGASHSEDQQINTFCAQHILRGTLRNINLLASCK